ncbi:MAG: DNA polymerase III subunit gamma/tau, partial [Lachnospiraceae bacterium]|nr:DNA polymerase III subunit gamma/tau [Lachnospiraceae bacterium]
LYRKFRPQTFSQVKGQDHVVLTLTNQIKNNRAGHAYLFTGTRGTGKTSVAKIFAKAVNCLHPVDGEPCNECEHCKAIMAGNFMDVVEIDAASNTGVDDIRRVIEEIQYTPAKGRYKVYIIDEAHMLSGSAANAFLKTLEEPPEYVIFILATTEPHKLPVTILSRCQRYDFKRISVDTIAQNLSALLESEGVASEEKAVKYIARAADGSMRDAISLLDKCIAFNLGEKLTYANVLSTLGTVDVETFSRLFRAISKGDVALALTTIEETIDAGKDISQFVSDFTVYIRNLLLVNVSGGLNMQIMGVGDENRALLEEDASLSEAQVLLRYIRILSELLNNIRYSAGKQILLEVAVIQMAKPQMETDIDSLTDRIRQLEEKIKDGVPAAKTTEFSYFEEDPFISTSAVFEPEYEEMMPDFEEEQEKTQEDILAAPAQGDATDVKASWSKVLDACSDHRLKTALGRASVEAEEDGVVIYAASEMAYKQLKEESAVAYVANLIKEVTGLSPHVQVNMITRKPEIENQVDLESILGNINFTIGTEE